MIQIVRTWMENDLVHFELSAPVDIFRPLSSTLIYLGELSHALNHKKKIACAGIQQTPEQRQAILEYQNKFKKLVLKHYDACITAGLTPNQAVSETNKAIKEMHQYNTSYDIVRNVCRHSKKKRPI